MITIEQRDEDFQYLLDTDETLARAKAYMEGIIDQKSTVLALEQLESNSRTIANAKAEAYVSNEYDLWCRKKRTAIYDYEKIRQERITRILRIECWRSENSARTKGVIS